jgi:hypothetical protein
VEKNGQTLTRWQNYSGQKSCGGKMIFNVMLMSERTPLTRYQKSSLRLNIIKY